MSVSKVSAEGAEKVEEEEERSVRNHEALIFFSLHRSIWTMSEKHYLQIDHFACIICMCLLHTQK